MNNNIAAAEILEAAAFVIGTGHFCKHSLAKDINGDGVSQISETAVAWCSVGALVEADETLGHGVVHLSSMALRKVINGWKCVGDWNNARERTAAEVETAMLQAAANLRGEA